MTRRAKATIGILVGLLLAALDGTIVATAMPQIMDDLGGLKDYALPVAVFMLLQTVSMPIWGRLSDMYGRARFHFASTAILVGGSVLCGFAHSLAAFIAYRALQGLGAGGVMSLSFTMIGDLYEGDQRARVQGAITSVWGVAALIGPLLGGWITVALSWRYIFFLNIPVGILAIAWVQATWGKRVLERKGMPDVAGALLLALAAGAVMTAFGLASHQGWSSRGVLMAFGAAALFVGLLIVVERKVRDPFLSYDLFRIRLFGTSAATGMCAMFCLFSAIIHVPYLVVGVLGEDLRWGGGMLTVMMIPWMACSAFTRFLLNRFGYRNLALGGMVFCTAAYVLLSRVGIQGTLWDVAGAMLLLGVGLGVTVAPLLVAAQNAVPRDRLGAATSLTQFVRSFGGAIGLTLMMGIMATAIGPENLRGIIALEHVTALARALGSVFLWGAGAALFGTLLALTIPGGLRPGKPVPA